MAGLQYREDMDEVRRRLTTWWDGGDIGRPAMAITIPLDEPQESVPPMEKPEGWVTHYSTTNFAYRAYLSRVGPASHAYAGEGYPVTAPDLAPNCVALFLGCEGVEMPGTVWCKPFITDPDSFDPKRLQYDRDNFYWDFCLRLAEQQLADGEGRFLLQFPDLIEGLDTLEAMRGAEHLLMDLVDRPEWVQRMLRQITDRYFHYYDMLYDRFRDEVGGSVFWAWAPGRVAKFQCDFSAMIGPDMFGEFMVPVLTEMCERVSYSLYHWDGPGAVPHHDHLLSVPGLDMLQWTPGAGQADTGDPQWWPLYHKTIEAGKKVMAQPHGLENLKAMKKEFGEKLKHFYMRLSVQSQEEAQEWLEAASF
jgi:5-methyltetrahydrofolate--homocysteine methyltransferase